MAQLPNPDEMRARFHELGAQRDKIKAKADPMRAKRDKVVNEAATQERQMNAAIREAEAGLYEIDCERGALARALSGKTGAPPKE
jgi:uncharacterized coiled-coil DUF342 family protein